jgi:hypothetical protein
MMRVLIAKELRALRPMAWCIVGVLVLGLGYMVATEMPDEQRLDPAQWLTEYRSGSVIVLGLFGLMMGAGVLLQESNQGTLRFLDGLPLSRTRIFAAKVIAALAVIALVPVLDLTSTLGFDWLSRTSVDGPFPWGFAGTQLWLQLVAGGFFVAFAMALSFTRNWFALVAGLLFWGYLWLRQMGVEQLAFFDPSELLAVGLDGGHVIVPWGHVAAHFAATVVLLAVAWAGFLSLGDRAQFAAQRLGKWGILRMLGTGLRLLAPVVWIAAMIKIAGPVEDEDAKLATTPLGEQAFGRHETARYEFLFRTAQREEAAPLFAAADEIHEHVADYFSAPPPPSRIVVDLASPVVPHAAGQTNWTKIRMPLHPGDTLEKLRQILGHETAHVYIEQLSEGRLSQHFETIRFLHEGLATHVEHMHFSTDEEKAQHRRSVAAAWARGRVPFELLCDNEKLIRDRDPNLVYPLGAVFARALFETQGADAPARLLRAFGRRNAPAGLTGTALWRDTTQAAGIDLDRVVAAYEGACAKIADEEKAFAERLPRITATVAIEGGEIVIRPKFEGTAPGEMICLVEIEGPLANETPMLPKRADGSFALKRERFTKPVIRYLLGWRTPETEQPVFEPWAQAAL